MALPSHGQHVASGMWCTQCATFEDSAYGYATIKGHCTSCGCLSSAHVGANLTVSR